MITDAGGNMRGTMSHRPFGEDLGSSGETEKHRFTTYERDSETGTDYAINRQYSTTTGRFMRPDPVFGSISNPQSLNRYAYSVNDPINLVDPDGLIVGSISSLTSLLLNLRDSILRSLTVSTPFGDYIRRNTIVNIQAEYEVGFGIGWGWPSSGDKGDRLSPCVKELILKIGPEFFKKDLLDKIRIHNTGIPGYVLGNREGYAEGNNIYTNPGGRIDQKSAIGISLLSHEIAHVHQYARNSWAFVLDYGLEAIGLFLGGLLTGQKPDLKFLHENSRYENEARAHEGLVWDYMERNFKNLPDPKNPDAQATHRDPCP
jgi:RHS repeat-associated protein